MFYDTRCFPSTTAEELAPRMRNVVPATVSPHVGALKEQAELFLEFSDLLRECRMRDET
jgi:hypothetical protein